MGNVRRLLFVLNFLTNLILLNVVLDLSLRKGIQCLVCCLFRTDSCNPVSVRTYKPGVVLQRSAATRKSVPWIDVVHMYDHIDIASGIFEAVGERKNGIIVFLNSIIQHDKSWGGNSVRTYMLK